MDTTLNHATTTALSNHPTVAKTTNSARVFENGTIIGAITESSPFLTHTNAKLTGNNLIIPEIVISASYSSQSLNQNRFPAPESRQDEEEETAAENTALLQKEPQEPTETAVTEVDALQSDEFEQFVLNRSTSDSNILESSIYSELQFPVTVTIGGGSGGLTNGSGGTTAASTTSTSATVVDLLNTSACSRDSSRHVAGGKRTRRKHKSKSKRDAAAAPVVGGGTYPPQYTAIFLDHLQHPTAGVGAGGVVANAMGQIASAAAASPFLNAPVAVTDANAYLQQQYQYYQQRPVMSGLGAALGHHHHHHHRTLIDPNAPHTAEASSAGASGSGSSSSSITAPASALNPNLRLSFRKWFSRPSLPFVIGILALGGVACTLGGIVLGSTGLIEHSTQYLSAALLMIGIGVSLLVISGAIWRLSLPDDVDECPCYRHMETCRNCNSPYCNNRLLAGSYLYPEFQHRPPPPSYLTSLNECAAMGLLFHPAATAPQAAYSTLRMNTPPPLYRSTNSLSVFVPGSNSTNTIAAAPCSLPSNSIVPALPNATGILPDRTVLTMSAVMENLQAQQQALTKELNYLELD